MAIGTVVTRGYGSGASIALVVTRGYTIGEAVAVGVQAAAVLMRAESFETQFTLQTIAVEFVVSGAPGYDNLLTEAGENLFTEDGRLILLE